MQYRKRGRSRRPRSLFSLGWPIVLLMLVLWGLAMGFITEMTAAELMQQAKVAAAEYVTYYAQGSF